MSSIDDEFEEIIAGLKSPHVPYNSAPEGKDPAQKTAPQERADRDQGEDETLETTTPAGGGDNAEPATSSDDSTMPATHAPARSRHIALILVPVAPAVELSKMLGFYGISRWVVPVGGPSGVWLELDGSEEDDFDILLGEDRPMPEECDRFARTLSRLTKHGAVALVSQLQEDENSTNGNVMGRRYLAGEPQDNVPAGLILNGSVQRVEDLLLGRTSPADYPDAVHPTERPEPQNRFGRPFRFGK
ncbi:MAG: hypothetical protein Q4P06_05850 [Actinomycetaceae bacterium]|nr:hypothetical protein [Actinomycetaceae bacterium]